MRAEAVYPPPQVPMHRMDEDDTPREVAPGPRGPPPPPPPGMGELLQSHNQMRAQIAHMANHVQETSNRAQLLEQRLAAEEHARAYREAEKRHAAATMYQQALYGPAAAAPPFLNEAIGQAAVPPPIAPPAHMTTTEGNQTKREAEEAPEDTPPKKQIVERVVERILERPADLSRPSVPDPPPQAAITYEPPKAVSDVMSYTHAGNPELARAVAHVVASLAADEKRGPKRAAASAPADLEQATQAADQSGSKPVVVRKKTRYTTMSRFNASQLIRRREAKRNEQAAIRAAKEEAAAAKVGEVVRRVIKRTKKTTPAPAGARLTPGRRAVVAV